MSEDVSPISTYVLAWLVLLALLGLNIGIAFVPLGRFQGIIAVFVAVLQVLVVMTYFMRLHRSTSLLRLFSAVGFSWLALLIALSLSDYLTRVTPPPPWPPGTASLPAAPPSR